MTDANSADRMFREAIERPEGEASSAGPGEGPGDRIGPYRILQEIGTGGFGVVYMAEQERPIRRKVALKIIKLGMDTKQVIARFEAERQALALMNHPNIARVLDAGATDAGRPYFVMELVRGIPITTYCDQHALTTDERLDLFIQVCNAVQHAHQKGIIHRDIKPSNIMVTLHDGEPVPKVIDFGIAKATNQRLTERTLFTEYRQFVGTPAYMSPEQAEMSGLDVDTRADIYSLGVLLYELLTGTQPYDAERLLGAGYGEIHRIIREEEPPKPSTRISSLGERIGTVARQRRIDAERLVRTLRGDLDWIVMKALEKDRRRRYPSASELAADVLRHLNEEAVIASPPSAGYRLGKFIRRNRGPVAATVALVVVLVMGVLGTSLGLVSAHHSKAELEVALEEAVRAESRATASAEKARIEARRADREAANAREQAEIARAVNDFLNRDLLAAVAPSGQRGHGKDVLMRDVLDVAAERIEQASAPGGRFSGKPVVEASIREAIGVTYKLLGRHDLAERHLLRAVTLAKRTHGEDHDVTLSLMARLGWLYQDAGRLDEAKPLLLKTVAMRRRVSGDGHPATASAEHLLGALYEKQGRPHAAQEVYAHALESLKGDGPEEREVRARLLTGLAIVYTRLSRMESAERLFKQVVEHFERTKGPDHLETLMARSNLASFLSSAGRLEEAETKLVAVLGDARRIFGEDHPQTLSAMLNLANLYRERGRLGEAEALLEETLRGSRRRLGDDHHRTLRCMANLGRLHAARGHLDRAAALLEETVKLGEASLGPYPSFLVRARHDLGAVAHMQGRLEVAARHLGDALRYAREAFGPDDWQAIQCTVDLGLLRQDQGRPDDALRLALDALLRSRRRLGPHHAVTEKAHGLVRKLYAKRGLKEADRPFDAELIRILSERARAAGAGPEDKAACAAWLLACRRPELRDPERARELALEASASAGGKRPDILETLAEARSQTGDHAGAIETLKEALARLPAANATRIRRALEAKLKKLEQGAVQPRQ